MIKHLASSDEAGPWVRILDEREDYRFGSLFRIIRATLQYRRFDGTMSAPMTRINFERGDSVGILLYDPVADAVLLVRQFRYPVYARLDPADRQGEGARKAWLLEIVAGVVDEGETPEQVAHRELLEETGYTVPGQLEPLATIYPSPGGTSERIHLFLARLNARHRADRGGGAIAEGEDIEVVELAFAKAMDLVTTGQISDAKTIIALQNLALRKAQQSL